MKDYILVVNRSSELVLVGDKYLYPGEQRSILRSLVEVALVNYPGALGVVEAEAEAKAEAEPVEAEATGPVEAETEPGAKTKKQKPAGKSRGAE